MEAQGLNLFGKFHDLGLAESHDFFFFFFFSTRDIFCSTNHCGTSIAVCCEKRLKFQVIAATSDVCSKRFHPE